MGGQQAWLTHLLLGVSCCVVVVSAYPYYPRPKREVERYPEENLGRPFPEYMQGDIRLTRRRSAVRDYDQTWTNRTVPYVMVNLTAQEQRQVLRAMEEIATKSCVRFTPWNKEIDYISINKMEGCSSSVGRTGGRQIVILGEGCYVNGIILHELMHALGFWHEHSRPDRDSYIQIMWSNIAHEHRTNFEKYDNWTIDTLDTVYDYGSVMHYKNNTFAMDRSRVTIRATFPIPPGVEMGQRVKLSDTDVLKLKRLYKCNITHCMNPGVPLNGVRTGESFQVGEAVFFSCNPGYQLYGSRRRSCLDLGQWTGNLPSCLPDPKGELRMCTFDDPGRPMCGWTADTTATRNWTLNSRSTPSNGTGPMEDHTMGSPEGWYIYLEATSIKSGEKARLLSPPMRFNITRSPASRVCMALSYSMHGKDMGTLYVYQRNMLATGRRDALIFNKTGEQGPGWKLDIITLPRLSFFAIVLEAVVGNGYLSDIAVDDVVVGPCHSFLQLEEEDEVADTLKCSFDSGLCGLEQDREDDFEWRLNRGETNSTDTGPKCDPVNCASGHYIYTEASNPCGPGNTARILTPLLHGDGMGRCLLFFWSMFGNAMGSLTVKMVMVDGSEQTLWWRSGDQGNQWHYERLDIIQPPRYYRLAFEGTIGRSYSSDMALDNIEVLVGECDDVVRNDCTFHLDLCSWENLDSLPWRRYYGNTPTPGTGPLSDHNNDTMEYYLYVESSRTHLNDTASLRSGLISGHQPGHCLQFWYHMHGANVGTLSVLIQHDVTWSEATLWQYTGSADNTWHRQSLFIRRPGQDFRIIFEARLTGGSEGDIAIDDISIHGGQCESQ